MCVSMCMCVHAYIYLFCIYFAHFDPFSYYPTQTLKKGSVSEPVVRLANFDFHKSICVTMDLEPSTGVWWAYRWEGN